MPRLLEKLVGVAAIAHNFVVALSHSSSFRYVAHFTLKITSSLLTQNLLQDQMCKLSYLEWIQLGNLFVSNIDWLALNNTFQVRNTYCNEVLSQ